MRVRAIDICIRLIYVFTYIFALTYIFWGLTNSSRWKIISAFPIITILILCFFYLVYRRFIQVKYIGILLFLMVIYELVVSAINRMVVMPNIIMDVITWPLMFWVILDYSKENEISESVANRVTIVGMTLMCALIAYVLVRRFRFGSTSGSMVFTTYFSFSFLPLVYLYCNRRMSMFYSMVVAILMVFSVKRASFIIVVIGISLYYIIGSYVAGERGRKMQRMFITMFALLLIGALGWYLINIYNIRILIRLSNSIEDGGSGRTRIWKLVLNAFTYSSREKKIFGHGFHSVYYNLRPFGISRFAHNGFIEALYDYGIVGLVLLVSIIIFLLTITIRMIRKKSTVAPPMCFTMVSMIVLTAISYFFEQSVMTIPHAMIWGICIGRFIRENRINNA